MQHYAIPHLYLSAPANKKKAFYNKSRETGRKNPLSFQTLAKLWCEKNAKKRVRMQIKLLVFFFDLVSYLMFSIFVLLSHYM